MTISAGVDEPAAKLKRSLGSFGVILLTLSVLSPAASVLLTGTAIVQQAGTGAIWAFLIGAVITAVVSTTQAELGASFPVAGGDYATVARTLGPFGGFLMFAMVVPSLPAFIALTSSGVAIFLHPLVPNAPALAVTVATIGVAMVIGILNVRTNAIITGGFLAIEVGALLLITALGLFHPARSLFDPLTHPLRLDTGGHLTVLTTGALALASVSAAYAVSGSNQAVYFGEEMKHPRIVGRLVMLILFITVVLTIAPVASVLVGARDIRGVMGAESPFMAFISESVSPAIATAISLAVATAIFNAAIAGVVAGSRVIYSSGRDEVWNGWTNRALMALHPRFNSPWVAALATGTAAVAMAFLSLNALVIVSASTALAGNVLLGFALYRGRRRGLTGNVGYRAPLFPLTAILSVVIAVGMAIGQFMDVEAGRPGLLFTLGLLVCASLYYCFALMRRPGGWSLAGPADLD
jgi:amino acid transporter